MARKTLRYQTNCDAWHDIAFHTCTHHTPLANGCTSQGAPNEQALPGRTEQALPVKEGAGCQAHGEEAARGREEEVLLARGEEDV